MAPRFWHRDLSHASKILPGDRARIRLHLRWRALADDPPAVHSGPRANVKHVVGFADGFFVVLDNNHGVALVAQAFQGVQKPAVVALVQANGGLIQHIEHPCQP